MNRKKISEMVVGALTLVAVLGAAWQARAQERYPRMAPLGEYLMHRRAEIALARSAAPVAISRDAEILVLGRRGFETAVKGKNGFICLVERSWFAPFDSPEFWNPKVRGPNCYNPPAGRTILRLNLKRTELALAGLSKMQIMERIKAAAEKKGAPAVEPDSLCYMMSKQAYLTDQGGHNLAHLMLYTPAGDGAEWGSDLPGSPVSLRQLQVPGVPGHIREIVIQVPVWSDRTPAPPDPQ